MPGRPRGLTAALAARPVDDGGAALGAGVGDADSAAFGARIQSHAFAPRLTTSAPPSTPSRHVAMRRRYHFFGSSSAGIVSGIVGTVFSYSHE